VGGVASEREQAQAEAVLAQARATVPQLAIILEAQLNRLDVLTDANSRQNWARVKAETETALLNMGFRDAYAVRPGFIQPMRGVTSRIRSIRWMYAVTAPA
jgi:hypothetical protein